MYSSATAVIGVRHLMGIFGFGTYLKVMCEIVVAVGCMLVDMERNVTGSQGCWMDWWAHQSSSLSHSERWWSLPLQYRDQGIQGGELPG